MKNITKYSVMIRLILLIIVIVFVHLNVLLAQTDTNIVYKDSILYKGKICNKCINGKKEGYHILFDFDGYYISHWDGIDSAGNWVSGTNMIYSSIRPIFDSLTGNVITKPSNYRLRKTDTVISNYWVNDPTVISEGFYKSGKREGKWKYLIFDKDLKGFIYIDKSPSAIGEYHNGEKTGEWNYYYGSGEHLAIVNYKAGIPIEPIIIYNKEGIITSRLKPISKNIFLDCEYDQEGRIIKCDTKNKNDYRIIFE